MNKYFPMFRDISGQKILIIGDEKSAEKKAEKLRPFEANIVFLTEKTESMEEILHDTEPHAVILTDETFADPKTLLKICVERKIELNVADNKEFSTFIFPSMITKGDLTVAVSTGGASPAAAVKIRKNIEDSLPSNIEEILDWLEEIRPNIKNQKNITAENRAKIFKALVNEAFALDRPLTDGETKKICEKTES